MKQAKTLDRREFTLQSALALLSGVAITISSGCGGSGGSPTTPSAPSPTGSSDKVGTISANHGHSAVITGAQLMAGGALVLNIQGSADHNHTVSLSAAEIASIAANQRVSRQSSDNDAHSHTVTFN